MTTTTASKKTVATFKLYYGNSILARNLPSAVSALRDSSFWKSVDLRHRNVSKFSVRGNGKFYRVSITKDGHAYLKKVK